jgi:hypothetical protein
MEIRNLYSRWARAFQARDLDGIMAVYAPENDSVVSYDVHIVHDHISVPADFATGKAVLDLKPQ